LLALDLDGTLLNSDSKISEPNWLALEAAQKAGVEIVIVTGRRYHSAQRLLQGIPSPVTVISSNGARIASTAGHVYYRNLLPRAVARRALAVGSPYRRYAVAIFDTPERGQVIMEQNAAWDGPVAWYLKNCPDCLQLVPELEAALVSDPIQVMFGGSSAFLEPLESLLSGSDVAQEVHLSWTKYLSRNISLLDVMNQGCSKGRALELWANQRGIASYQVMAIGDNHNDLEMLHFAGLPVLMGNHCEGLQCNGWPLTHSNDADGVAAAIKQYILD
jgi:Cof subfamily protein (haloacid dehalogenase superfamily)